MGSRDFAFRSGLDGFLPNFPLLIGRQKNERANLAFGLWHNRNHGSGLYVVHHFT